MNTNFHTESRMRENCTYGSMRGRTYPAGASRSTLLPADGMGTVPVVRQSGSRVELDAPAGYVRPLIEPYVQFSRIRLTVWNI